MTARSDFWNAWLEQRREELMASGMNYRDAMARVTAEVRQRKKMEKEVGRAAALEGELITRYRPNGTFGVYMIVPEASVPESLLPGAIARAVDRM